MISGAVVRDGRLELPTSCSQSKRATNCANPGFLVIQFCSRCGQTCGQAFFLTISACGGSACIAGVSRNCGHSIFRLEVGATRSQTTRATNCANPGFLVIEFCTRCGQTCGQADFLTTSAYGEIACISGVSRDCGHGIFRLEGGATRSQTRRDTNFAIPGYSLFCHDTTASGKNKVFSVCGHSCGQSHFYAVFGNRWKSRKCRCHKALRRFALPRPGYRHGTPKPGAIPTSLYPDTFSVYHSCGWKGRENFWFT